MARERCEPLVPGSPDLLEPGGRVIERGRFEPVPRLAPLPLGANEPRSVQGRQMLRNGLSRDGQLAREFRLARAAVRREPLQHEAPARIGERDEDVVYA